MRNGRIRFMAWILAALLLGTAAAAETVPTATPEPTPVVTRTPAEKQAMGVLTVGAKGDEVTRLQQRLKDLGYLSGKVDGQFGGGTKRAVIAFQRRNGLETDGVAGENTLAKLYAEDAVAAPADNGPVDVLAGELPMLVNGTHMVDEYFTPADLVKLTDVLSSKLVTIKYKKTRGVRAAVEALGTMLEAAKADGLSRWQVSAGYRTWDDQVSILNSRTNSYLKRNEGWSRSKARSAALRTVAEPGASEHHLGLAFDLNVRGASTFAGTKQAAWLNEHCWEYGFIIRYQKEKEEITGIAAEPWHVRYVGTEHSLYMQEHGLCLEEYLQGIADGTIVPLAKAETEDVMLEDEPQEAAPAAEDAAPEADETEAGEPHEAEG